MKLNKSVFAILLSVTTLQGITPVRAGQYTIDPTHAFVEFRIKHLGYSWLIGRFNKIEGVFNYDPTKGSAAQTVAVTIHTDSIDSNHAERDKHIRNYLAVGNFDKATFVSTGFTGNENGGVMTGKLTLHSVTKEVRIAIEKIGEGADPWGGYRAGFEGRLKFNRKDFGIDYDLGPQSWEVELSLYIEGVRNK